MLHNSRFCLKTQYPQKVDIWTRIIADYITSVFFSFLAKILTGMVYFTMLQNAINSISSVTQDIENYVDFYHDQIISKDRATQLI